MKRALIYCRISSRRQEGNTSLDSQEETGKKWAEENGYTVDRVTREIYTGADFFERPKLCIDRADIRAGRFDAIVIDCIDRLGRDIAGLAIVAEECRKANCELVFVNEPLDMSPEGKLITSVRSFMAEVERLKIRERTMRGRRAKILQGRPVLCGRPLFGYLPDPENERWVINELEAPIVRRIYDLALQGFGAKVIARKLNQQGIPSQTGKQWNLSVIHRMLTHSEYKGVSYANRYVLNESKKTRLRTRSEWVRLNTGTHPAIIGESVWDAVNYQIQQQPKYTAKNEKQFILLRGLVFCDACKNVMHTFYSREKDGSRRYRLRCGRRDSEKEQCRESITIGVRRLDPMVWEDVRVFIDEPEKLEAMLTNSLNGNNPNKTAAQIKEIEGRIKKAEQGIDRLLTTFRTAPASLTSHVENQITVAVREKEALQAALLSLQEKSTQTQRIETTMQGIRSLCASLRRYTGDIPEKVKRKLLETLGVRVYIGSTPHPRIEFNPFSF